MSNAEPQQPAVAGRQTRDGALRDAAWANEPRSGTGHDRAAGLNHVADALAEFAACLTDGSDHPAAGGASAAWHDIDTSGPSLEDPWDQEVADALAELHAADAAGWWRRPSDDPELRARLSAIPETIPRGVMREDQDQLPLAIERRFDQLEQCIGFVLRDLATRADVAGLKHLEAQVDGLLARAEEARAGFARLFSIENSLAVLKAAMDDYATRPLAASMLADHDLERIADATADRIVQVLTAGPDGGFLSAGAADTRTDERLFQLQAMFAEFAGERRRNERQVAEALDTMQEAMERILDRIDEIEAQQRNPASDPGEPRAMDRSQLDAYAEPPGWTGLETGEQLKSEARAEARTIAAPEMPEFGFDETSRTEPYAETDRKGWASRAWGAVKAWRPPGVVMLSADAHDRDHAGSTIGRPRALVIASLLAFLMAGFWLATGGRLDTPADLIARTHQSASRHAQTESSEQAVPPRLAVANPPAREVEPHGQQERIQAGTASPSTAAVQDHGVQGIFVERSEVRLSPEDFARIQQRQRMAKLSSGIGRRAAESGGQALPNAGGDLVTGTTGHASSDDAHRSANVAELPPLTIGPHSLRHAAARGDASAQFEVAARFAEGKGVEQDFGQAAIWYERAAEQGLATAQYRLATLHERGVGIARDVAQARLWYQRSAEQGNVKAMHNLAVLSAGKDVPNPDYATALKWFTAAAEHGLSDSQYNLGIMYENGLGVPSNLATAYLWYGLAAQAGDKEAQRRRDALRVRLAPGAVKAAEQQIETWQARAVDPLVNDPRAAGEAWKARASAPAG